MVEELQLEAQIFRELTFRFTSFNLLTIVGEFKAIGRPYSAEVKSSGFRERLAESWMPTPASSCVTLNEVFRL